MITADEPRSSPIKQVLSYAGLAITVQPASQLGVIGGQAVFGPVAYTSQFPITPQLQWQIRLESSQPWQVLVETTGFYEGVATATLTVKAIDNYLARSSGQQFFRLAIFYPGAAAIYSNEVSLTVARRVTWSENLFAFGGAQTGQNASGSNRVILQVPAGPQAVGFTATSFLWTRVSGSSSFVCSNAAIANPSWSYTAVPAGLTQSLWKCTLSNGVTTIDSDPVPLFALGVAATADSPAATGPTSPLMSSDGVNIFATGSAVVTPWAIALQRNIRWPSAPVVSITTPTARSTGFGLGVADANPGSAVLVYAFEICSKTPTMNKIGSVGGTSWQN